jgi:hypothetical protein
MVNPVELLQRDDVVLDDRRRYPDSGLRVGDHATLCVRTEHDMPNICQWEYVSVEVTSVLGEGLYRGEVCRRPTARMIPPEKLRIGSPLEFTLADVFQMNDGRPHESE